MPASAVLSPEIANLHPQVCNVRVIHDNAQSLLLFFDMETTGFGIYQVQILEFGMVAALATPGKPLLQLGNYSSKVLCKMRFPEDITVLTKIKNWYHPDSELKGAPALPEVNMQVLKKIIAWRKVGCYYRMCVFVPPQPTTHTNTQQAEAIVKTKIFTQFVTWNGDSYDMPLWMLQTGERNNRAAHTHNTNTCAHHAQTNYKGKVLGVRCFCRIPRQG